MWDQRTQLGLDDPIWMAGVGFLAVVTEAIGLNETTVRCNGDLGQVVPKCTATLTYQECPLSTICCADVLALCWALALTSAGGFTRAGGVTMKAEAARRVMMSVVARGG